jgi:hypothetical protein
MLCFSYSSACPGATRASQRAGFPLGWEEAAREADYCFRLSLVSEAQAGSSRLDEMDDELDWDAVPAVVLRIHLA